jgi:hypothetical protein
MKKYFPNVAALVVGLIGALAPALFADQWNKKTDITVTHPIAVEGTVLPAGSYVIRVLTSSVDGSVVQVFDSKNRLAATVFPVPAYRVTPTEKSVITFYEAPDGQPPALHTWFYSGDHNGFEFRNHHSEGRGPSAERAGE